MTFLADTSIWVWARSDRRILEKLADRVEADEVRAAPPIALELLHSARNGKEYEFELAGTVGLLEWLPLTQEAGWRAFETQRELARTTHGAHRIPAIDYLVVATAEASGPEVVVWHADRDIARICDFIGHPHEHERVRRRT